jgi:hydroxypyruvate isomerase
MLRFSANLGMLFGEAPFLDRFALAAQAGFEGVEYAFPYEFPIAELGERLAQHRLEQVLLNLPAGDWARGERGIACHPDRQTEFRDGVGRGLEYASALGCTMLNCLAGTTPQAADEVAFQMLVENLRFAARELEARGVRLLLEPINTRDMPGFYVSRLAHGAEVCAAVGSDNLWLQCDIYHLQVMSGDLAQNIDRHWPRIAHFQIADNPGRHEPGTGEINYRFLLPWLERRGYTGWVGCEYRPASTTSAGLRWLDTFRSPGGPDQPAPEQRDRND